MIVTAEGQVKVLDFELRTTEPPPIRMARSYQETALTEAGVVMGSVAYMSPEQAGAKPMDHRRTSSSGRGAV